MEKQFNEYSLVRLFEKSKDEIINHITSLNDEDRYLRFGYLPKNSMINKYVNYTFSKVNTESNANFWFAVTKNNKIVATIHIAIYGDEAEFAFTTDKNHRGKKLGQLLFSRGYQLITEFGINRIKLTCLSQNSAMKHIASKFGLKFTYSSGEVDAVTYIQYPVTINQVNELKKSAMN